ncbi:MAG: hypothetical protein AAF503_03045 [Pseudomonadota bacterium]
MQFKVIGIEVVQSIQDLENSVPLFASRPTLVRVYTSATNVGQTIWVKGELEVKHLDSAAMAFDSQSSVVASSSGSKQLVSQRRDINRSLNFVVPRGVLESGPVDFRLSKLWSISDPGTELDLDSSDDSDRLRLIVEAPTSLKCHVVGVITTNANGTQNRPRKESYCRIKKEILELLPISELDFSCSEGEAPEGIKLPFSRGDLIDGRDVEWEHKHNIICAFLMARRICDIETKERDPKTIYYGMVADDGSLEHAAVSNVPDRARPSIVSAGPETRTPELYAVHEIGHVMTCLHPGHPQGSQKKTDHAFPDSYLGRISDDHDKHMGWRSGTKGSHGTLLPYWDFKDFMGYVWKSGISAHNYLAVAHALADIDGYRPEVDEVGYIAVIGVFDKNEKTLSGEIRYVYRSHTRIPRSKKRDKDVQIVVRRKGGLRDRYAIDRKFENGALHTNSGPFQISIPYTDDIESFELVVKTEAGETQVHSKSIGAMRCARLGG